MLKIEILFENQQLLAINKPAGLVVNRAESVKVETLQDWVEAYYPLSQLTSQQVEDEAIKSEFINRSGIVHRLDKETSGVLLIARTPASFEALKNQFKQRQVQKTYLGLAHGWLEPSQGDINLPTGRLPGQRGRFGVLIGGRTARTFYTTKQQLSYQQERFSYLKLEPKTGRTHQLRIHLKHLGHPLVADPLYLGSKRLIADKSWCPRLFLHAFRIEFKQPLTGKAETITASLTDDLTQVLKTKFNNAQT